MRIIVDENIPLMTVNKLRKQGHDVIDIRNTDDQGIKDEELWQKAQSQRRSLITTDKGFSSYREESHYGLLIVRLKRPTSLKIHDHIMRSIRRHSQTEWAGLMVVERDAVQSSWKSHRMRK